MKVKSWPSTGIADKGNLKVWADYAKGNSYQCDNAKLKDNLEANASGGPKSRESDWSKTDWKQPRGCATDISPGTGTSEWPSFFHICSATNL